MIQMNLKRKYENNSCTHGILTIPAYHFRCVTLELCDGDDLIYKHDCRIPEGSYTLVRGFAQQWPSFPVFKKKPKGFAQKPEFHLSANTYMELRATSPLAQQSSTTSLSSRATIWQLPSRKSSSTLSSENRSLHSVFSKAIRIDMKT